MKRLRHFIEFVALRLLHSVLERLPVASAEKSVKRLADAWYILDGSRRRTARDNIIRSGIADDSGEVDRIARESFRHFGMVILEALRARQVFDKDNWRDLVETDIPEATMSALKTSENGVILVSGHLGNWEIAAQLLSFIKPVVGITRKLNNPYLDRWMLKIKPRHGFSLTPKHDARPDRLLSVLKNGHILALLADQRASSGGMMIDFFGCPALTYTSPALLHLVTGAPLCFGYCIRTGRMSYKLTALAPIERKPTGDRERDVKAILEELNRELERAIRQNPEQYLWAHRRWRAGE